MNKTTEQLAEMVDRQQTAIARLLDLATTIRVPEDNIATGDHDDSPAFVLVTVEAIEGLLLRLRHEMGDHRADDDCDWCSTEDFLRETYLAERMP